MNGLTNLAQKAGGISVQSVASASRSFFGRVLTGSSLQYYNAGFDGLFNTFITSDSGNAALLKGESAASDILAADRTNLDQSAISALASSSMLAMADGGYVA